MVSARILVVVGLFAATGCKDRSPTASDPAGPAPDRSPAGTIEALPGHPPQADEKMPYATTTGRIEAVVDGTPVTFTTLPAGSNMWVHTDRIRRLLLTGETGPNEAPRLQIYAYGFDLARGPLPRPLSTDHGAGHVVEIRYERDGHRFTGSNDAVEVVLEDVVGGRFRGRFAGTLTPMDPRATPVRIVRGHFDVVTRTGGSGGRLRSGEKRAPAPSDRPGTETAPTP